MNTDNQQETASADIAWMAGVIEGDGTLTLGAWRRDRTNPSPVGNVKILASVTIYNTDAGIIRKMTEVLETMGINPHLKSRDMKPLARPDGGHYHSPDPMLTLSVKGMDDVHRLLKAIRPWLFGDKGARADLMLRYLDRRFAKFGANSMGTRTPYDEEDIATVREFYGLTRRGRVDALDGLLND